MISTKGRYALRLLIDVADQGDKTPVPLRDVAERQGISEKYLQHVSKQLVSAALLVGTSGRGGGYRLARSAEKIYVLEALEAAEGPLAPVACLKPDAKPCERAPYCKTLPLWQRFDALTRELFGSVTIADLAGGNLGMLDDLNL